jgi:hypothetical protein
VSRAWTTPDRAPAGPRQAPPTGGVLVEWQSKPQSHWSALACFAHPRIPPCVVRSLRSASALPLPSFPPFVSIQTQSHFACSTLFPPPTISTDHHITNSPTYNHFPRRHPSPPPTPVLRHPVIPSSPHTSLTGESPLLSPQLLLLAQSEKCTPHPSPLSSSPTATESCPRPSEAQVPPSSPARPSIAIGPAVGPASYYASLESP